MSMPEPNPADELYSRQEATQALNAAVAELAQRLGESIESMEQRTLGECYAMAVETYGDQLPDFWRIWGEWQKPYKIPPMGEL